MSDYVLSASLELRDNFTTTVRSAVDEFRRMNGTVGSAVDDIKKKFKEMNLAVNDIKGMQDKLNGFAKKATIGVVTGSGAVGAFLKSSYMGYVDLNEQLVKNAAFTSATEEEQAKLKKQVDELGASTKFTALEVAKAQMYQAMAGYDVNKILEVTPTLMKLAIATGEDLASTSDMVTDNLSAFGLSVQDAGMFADTLASIANRTNTTVGMLGNAFTQVAGTSATMGEDFREVATMLGILADNGIKGEKAGTGLNAIYARLAKVTPEMRKQLELTNTKIYDENNHFLGLRKIIEDSKPALEKLTEEQRNYWLATIVGTENLKTWTAVMNNSIESTEKAEKAAYNATGSLDTFVETMNKTDRYKIDELGSAFDAFKRKIGEALSPVVMENVQNLTTYLNDLTNSDDISTENLTNFFDTVVSNAKIAASAFLATQIAFLGLRASMGDYTAMGQLALMASAGVALGIYGGLVHADKVNKTPNKSNLENGASYIKKNKKGIDYDKAFDKYNVTNASSSSYGAIQQLNYEKAKYYAQKENELFYPEFYNMNYDNLYNKNLSNETKFELEKPSYSKTENFFKIELDVKGVDNIENKTVIEDITKETLFKVFQETNMKHETRI